MRALLLVLVFCGAGCGGRSESSDAGPSEPYTGALPRPSPGEHFFFGHDINLSGDDAIVGVRQDDGGGPTAGAVYIFHRDVDGVWDNGFRIQNPKNTPCRFGTSVDIDGDWAVASARFACGHPGAVYVFKRNGTGNAWQQVLELNSPDPFDGDMFGDDVAIEGDVLAIGQGSRRNPSGGSTLSQGPAYVAMRDDTGTWGPLQMLIPNGGFQSGEGYGALVALSGDDLLVGAGRIGTTAGSHDTSVYLYRRTPGTAQYTETARMQTPDGIGGNFGQAAAIGGNLLVVGAPQVGLNNGRAYVFERPSATEPFGPATQVLPAPEMQTPRWQVGASVATDGTRVIIGAPGGRAAKLFERDAGTWTDVGPFLNIAKSAPYGELGWRVAIDGERILVSDPAAEDDADNGGMVYVR